jgi:hypothetical protein
MRTFTATPLAKGLHAWMHRRAEHGWSTEAEFTRAKPRAARDPPSVTRGRTSPRGFTPRTHACKLARSAATPKPYKHAKTRSVPLRRWRRSGLCGARTYVYTDTSITPDTTSRARRQPCAHRSFEICNQRPRGSSSILHACALGCPLDSSRYGRVVIVHSRHRRDTSPHLSKCNARQGFCAAAEPLSIGDRYQGPSDCPERASGRPLVAQRAAPPPPLRTLRQARHAAGCTPR